jgi:hypothetical protein
MVSTTMSVPQTVLASISSAIAETISAQSTTAAVSVIINQVFALSLPCADENSSGSSLSTGAKAGIGVGVAVGGLILITLVIWFCVLARRRRKKKEAQVPVLAGPPYTNVPNQMYDNKQYPVSPTATHPPPSGYQGSPPIHQQGFGPHGSWQQPPTPVAYSGHVSVSSDGMRQYGAASPGLPPGYMEASAYHTQARSQTHEMPEE